MKVLNTHGETVQVDDVDVDDMAKLLIGGMPVGYVLEASMSRYELVIVPFVENVGVRKTVPDGRFVVAVPNFQVAWHFGMTGEQHWAYVAEKLGMSEADASNIAGFLEMVGSTMQRIRDERAGR